jgi:hypothetical protein
MPMDEILDAWKSQARGAREQREHSLQVGDRIDRGHQHHPNMI